MSDTPEIAAARIEAERARSRLMAVAHELQVRLAPATLARNTWQGAKEKGADLAEEAVDAVKARPLAATGVVAAFTMFLAREPLMSLAAKLARGGARKRPEKAGKTEKTNAKAQLRNDKDRAKASAPAPQTKKTETAT